MLAADPLAGACATASYPGARTLSTARPPAPGRRRSPTAARQPRLVALGDLLLDVVVTPERPIEQGTDVPGRVVFRRGGSAANVAAAFAAAGGAAALITSIGDDPWAGRLLASLRADGVRVHAVKQPGASGRLAALVDERGERSFVTERGAADDLRPSDIEAAWLRSVDVLHVPAYSLFVEPIGSAAVRAARLVQERGALVSTDLSSEGPLLAFGVRHSRARIGELKPAVLFANREEAAALLREKGRRAWAGLLAHAPLAVVTDGAWGCRVLWRDPVQAGVRQLDVATERIASIDSTGAGDAFAAGFLYTLLRSGGVQSGLRDPIMRRAALAGHRTAAEALRRGRPEIEP